MKGITTCTKPSSKQETLHSRLRRLCTIGVLVTTTLIGHSYADPALPVGSPSCNPAELKLIHWPLDGVQGHDWIINNFVDLDATSPGTKDWMNRTGDLALTYDNHTGLDIDIPSFRDMDSYAAIIRAAAPGMVSEVVQDKFDRNTEVIKNDTCHKDWNLITVKHANGYSMLYGHIKKDSAQVKVGQVVNVGDALAIAGSSGCSSQPHVHFEVRDCNGQSMETMLAGMWSSPPSYEVPSGVMDVMLTKGEPTIGQIKDPMPNVSNFESSDMLGIGLSMAGKDRDIVDLEVFGPSNQLVRHFQYPVQNQSRYGHLYLQFKATLETIPGTWLLKVSVNRVLKAIRSFNVSSAP